MIITNELMLHFLRTAIDWSRLYVENESYLNRFVIIAIPISI